MQKESFSVEKSVSQNGVGDFTSVNAKDGEHIPDFYWNDGNMNET